MLGKKLGKGTFGDVSEYCHENKTYAAKRKPDEFAIRKVKDKDDLYGIQNDTLAEFDVYTNMPPFKFILPATDAIVSGNDLYEIIPLMSGSLDELKNISPNLNTVLLVTKQIFEGLQWMHTHGYVHCDFKPANVLYNKKQSCIKIADFGACQRWKDGWPNLTDSIKTPITASPEQYLQSNFNSKSDVWSAGCTIYEFYTGKNILNYFSEKYPQNKTHQIYKRFMQGWIGWDNLSKSMFDVPEVKRFSEYMNYMKEIDINAENQNIFMILDSMIKPNPNHRQTFEELLMNYSDILQNYPTDKIVCEGLEESSVTTDGKQRCNKGFSDKPSFFPIKYIDMTFDYKQEQYVTPEFRKECCVYAYQIFDKYNSDKLIDAIPVFFNAIWILDYLFYTENINATLEEFKRVIETALTLSTKRAFVNRGRHLYSDNYTVEYERDIFAIMKGHVSCPQKFNPYGQIITSNNDHYQLFIEVAQTLCESDNWRDVWYRTGTGTLLN